MSEFLTGSLIGAIRHAAENAPDVEMGSDRNCWTCDYNDGNFGCECILDDVDEDQDLNEWMNANCANTDLIPPRETATPCPGWVGEHENE